jgi:hypothetical protein
LSDQLGLRQGERRTARDEPEAPRRPRPVALRGTGDCSQLSGGAGAWGGDVNQAHAGPVIVGDAEVEQPRRKEWKRRFGACVHGLNNICPRPRSSAGAELEHSRCERAARRLLNLLAEARLLERRLSAKQRVTERPNV